MPKVLDNGMAMVPNNMTHIFDLDNLRKETSRLRTQLSKAFNAMGVEYEFFGPPAEETLYEETARLFEEYIELANVERQILDELV